MSIIKPKRGTGSPAGSIATNEIAMDTAAKILYVSTDGTNAVNLADDTQTFLAGGLFTYSGSNATGLNLGTNVIDVGSGGTRLDITPGTGGMRINSAPDMRTNKITNMGDPTDAQDAVTKNYVDTAGGLPTTGGTMTGDLNIAEAVGVNFLDTEYGMELHNTSSGQPTLALRAMATAASQRRTSLLFQQDDSGSVISQGIIEYRHRGNTNDEFRISHLTDDGATKEEILEYVKNSATTLTNGHFNGTLALGQDKAELSYRLDVNSGRTNSGSTLSPHAIRANTDMSADLGVTIANSATFNLDYGVNTRTNTVQNAIKFQITNDGDGTDTVGQISATYNTATENNSLRIQGQNDSTAGNATGTGATGENGRAEVSAVHFSTNVPYSLPEYTLAEANALPSKEESMLIYVSNGNAGAKTLAVYDGSNWKVVALGATIS